MARRKPARESGNGANLGFEEELWAAADKMRGHMDAAEYKHVVLGLIFLKYTKVARWEHLQFLARSKKNGKYRDRRGQTLFIDARKMGALVDRTHRDLTDDDIQRIAKTYHAWRGEKGAGMTDNLPASASPNSGEFILFQSEDGSTRIEVRFAGETVWLSINQMADLFQRDKSVISRHISNLFEERELRRESVVAVFATTAADRKTYQVEYYNLDVIISVGYRVKSHRGTQFRIWATERLREYLIKGFAMDDDRLKRAGGGNYFEELLARIRDIRSSERVFWRKVLDIYATSIDYDPSTEASQLFFKTVQNKMHWASHGQTAAEVIHRRADAGQPYMGLTSWAGNRPRKTDVAIAKNYLNADELNALNRIVTAYLEFAEVQALNRRPMYMADWIEKLDNFLRLSDRDILTHAGKISHEDAVAKAESEFEQYRRVQAALPEPVDEHFEQTLDELKRIECQNPPKAKKEPNKSTRKPKPPRSGDKT